MPLNVNGEIVNPDWVHDEFSQIKSYHERTTHASCCERDDEFMSQAKENVIRRLLIAQEADKAVPKLSDNEIDLAIRQLKKEMGGEAQFYAHYGILPNQEDMIRPSIDQSVRVDKHVRSICGNLEPEGDDVLIQFYQDNINKWMSEETIRCLHIYRGFRSDRNRDELYKELAAVRLTIKNEADFMQAAEKFTDKEQDEIDLGWFKRGDIMEEFEIITFSMNQGEVSPVFSTHHGFHLAFVAEKNPAKPAPFENVREEVLAEFKIERREKRLHDHVDELRKHAQVVGDIDEN